MTDQIGRGVYAKVYLEGNIAIKVMPAKHLVNGVKEAILLTLAQSPHVVELKNIMFTNARSTRLTLCRYETDLYNFIKGRRGEQYPFPGQLIETLAIQLFTGLKYIHSRGITHCDIKPQNLLINLEPFKLVICDFGISTLTSELYHTARAQTCNYRAPEINIRQKTVRYTQAIDIWSAGCILFEILSGQHFINYRANIEDTTIYLCEILGLPADNTRRARKKILRAITYNTIVNYINLQMRPDASPIISTMAALCLAPEVSQRPTATQSLSILSPGNNGSAIAEATNIIEAIQLYEKFIKYLPKFILETCDYECLMLASKIYHGLSRVTPHIHSHACVVIARCLHNGDINSLRDVVGGASPEILTLALTIINETQGELL